ncbi:MAG: hypothetical protein QGD94_06145, partial [Planctomycetia bacterium]|nr:hypothetical protein [Planctomycetia bacterium]
GGAKKQDIAFVVAWAVQRHDFDSLRVTRTGVRFEGALAVVELTARVAGEVRSARGLRTSRWQLKLGLDGDGRWRVRQILCLSPFPGTPEELWRKARSRVP